MLPVPFISVRCCCCRDAGRLDTSRSGETPGRQIVSPQCTDKGERAVTCMLQWVTSTLAGLPVVAAAAARQRPLALAAPAQCEAASCGRS